MSLNIDFPNICKLLNDHEKMLMKYKQSQNFCIPVIKVLPSTTEGMDLILGQGTKILIKLLKKTTIINLHVINLQGWDLLRLMFYSYKAIRNTFVLKNVIWLMLIGLH